MGNNIAIITAAGSGSRFDPLRKKQFITLSGRPLLFWTIDKFFSFEGIDRLIITLPSQEISEFGRQILAEYNSQKIQVIPGGSYRQESVYLALQSCPSDTEFVFIHDGVRPFIDSQEISLLFHLAKEKKAVVPGYRLRDTIKKVNDNLIEKTISRDNLIAVATPQIFSYQIIMECHQKAKGQNLLFTDDAAILEHFGHSVYWLECSVQNIKITEYDDLEIAKILLNKEIERTK
jgi:2-C-methyl-D-erythritol 4-phosphate cytidylyltransferase